MDLVCARRGIKESLLYLVIDSRLERILIFSETSEFVTLGPPREFGMRRLRQPTNGSNAVIDRAPFSRRYCESMRPDRDRAGSDIKPFCRFLVFRSQTTMIVVSSAGRRLRP